MPIRKPGSRATALAKRHRTASRKAQGAEYSFRVVVFQPRHRGTVGAPAARSPGRE